jgi:hypothetical protein
LGERRFSLRLYLLIVFGLSWPFQIVSVLGPATLAWAVVFNSLTMIMVGVATFLCARYVSRDGLSDAGWSSVPTILLGAFLFWKTDWRGLRGCREE